MAGWNPMYHRQFGRLSDSEADELARSYRWKLIRTIKGRRNLILSGEVIYRFSDDSIHRLKADLQRCGFEDFQVLLYYREPAGHYLSRMQQRSRHSYPLLSPINEIYPYRETWEKWNRHFPDRVMVRPFERNQLLKGDSLADFLHVASEFFCRKIPTPESPLNKNPSLSVESIHLLQVYWHRLQVNDQFEQDPVYFNFLIRLINREAEGRIKGTQPRLRPEIATMIRYRHIDQLRFLRDQLGITFNGIDPEALVAGPQPELDWADSTWFRTICTDFDHEAYETISSQMIAELTRRHIRDSRYLDWLQQPYWAVRRYIRRKMNR